ncbi:MAG: radical SAM protein [Deltaproteobacteria bacterium]|nr:radical SAM protein [Deltaproteobacteria bacterium]
MKKINHESEAHSNPLIIPVFIMNSGCPHRCIFCNQKITSGNFPPKITKEFFNAEVKSYLAWNKDKSRKVEIAFYGGSFTGVDQDYQEELLSWGYSFIQKGLVNSIRISTRPDYISENKLPLLKKYGVTTVEIGAQSFIDEVLQSAQRGHDSAAIVKAMTILKDYGFWTGLHIMAGLPKDTKEGFIYSLDKTIKLKPDTVRIHPVIVFSGTALAEEFHEGKYKPLELSDAVELCRLAWGKLSIAGIRIIRMGVQLTQEMEKDGAVLAGPIHPAFGSLVLSSIFYDYTVKLLGAISRHVKELHFNLSERDISNFRGLNNMNISAIKKLYPHANLIVESIAGQPRGEISVATDLGKSFILNIPGII